MGESVLVLDAMGVIYSSSDDVEELLIPFIMKAGGIDDAAEISRQYTLASLGELDAETFWRNVGLSRQVEDEYLAQHRLTVGLIDFLDTPPLGLSSVWCLSNDVAEWSQKLRAIHHLEQRITGFVVSGEVGSRKPSLTIYEKLFDKVRCHASSVVFVDDRIRNLDTATTLGFRTVHFDPRSPLDRIGAHPVARSFADLWKHLADQHLRNGS